MALYKFSIIIILPCVTISERMYVCGDLCPAEECSISERKLIENQPSKSRLPKSGLPLPAKYKPARLAVVQVKHSIISLMLGLQYSQISVTLVLLLHVLR